MGISTKYIRGLIHTETGNIFDIRNYLPNGATQLTTVNWRTAHDAALAAAVALYPGAFPLSDAGVPIIYVPEGTWPITGTPLKYPGTPNIGYSVGMMGAGRNSTIFLDQLTGGVGHTGAIIIGSPEVSGQFHVEGVFGGFTLHDVNEDKDGVGIHLSRVLNLRMRDVNIRGYSGNLGQTDLDARGIGILLDTPEPDTNPNQHVFFENVSVNYANTGAKLTTVANLRTVHFECGGCFFAGATYDNAEWLWDSGVNQGSGQGETNAGQLPNFGVPSYAIRPASTRVVYSGSAASIAASSGGTSVITGLTGIGFSYSNIGRMLRLQGVASKFNNMLFEIIELIDTDQVRIAGSHLVAETGVTWAVREQSGQDMITIRNTYHENQGISGWFKSSRTKNDTSSFITLTDNIVQNVSRLADLRGSVAVIRNNYVAGASLTLRDTPCETDMAISQIDADPQSFTRLKARNTDKTPFAGNSDSSGRLVGACMRAGAVAIWDARNTTSLNLTGTAVHSWTDLVNGVVLSPENSGIYPIRLPADSDVGTDAVKFTGNVVNTLTDNLTGNILGSSMPSQGHGMCVMAIMRVITPDDQTTIGGGTRRVGVKTTDRSLQLVPGGDGGGAVPIGQWGGVSFTPIMFNAPAASGVLSTTNQVRAMIFGGCSTTVINTMAPVFVESSQASPGTATTPGRQDPVNTWPGNTNTNVHFGYPGTQRGSFVLAYFAVFPSDLGTNTRQSLLDLAKNEWPNLIRS